MSDYYPQSSSFYKHNYDNQNLFKSNNTSSIRKSDHENHNSHIFNNHSHNHNTETQYIPRVIQSGYIVGPPIAYSNSPTLPTNLQPFNHHGKITTPVLIDSSNNYLKDLSPKNSNIINNPSKIIINSPTSSMLSNSQIKIDRTYSTSQQHIPINQPLTSYQINHPISSIPINHIPSNHTYKQPLSPSIIIHPPNTLHQQQIPVSQYNKCLSQCKNWQSRYNQLYLKYMNLSSQSTDTLRDQNYKLKQRIKQYQSLQRNRDGKLRNVKQLIQRYKESTLKECYLLMDRYRLELKKKQ